MIYSLSSYYYLVHLLLAIAVSCNQCTFIPLFPIHNFGNCVTGILSQVAIHDSIQNSVILDIRPSSFHELPDLSFRDPLCVFNVIFLITNLSHNIRMVFFAPNKLNVYVLFLYQDPYKIMMYINVLSMHTNLSILR